jgi:hypothetical protein
MDNGADPTRRRVLTLCGVSGTLTLAGCLGDSSADDELAGPIPEPYRTATAQGGTERSTDGLQSKSSVNYQDAQGTNICENCIHYIPDKNDDELGACSLVEGYIEPNAWCSIYSRYVE